MIDKKTVFILGAGASCPYGYPSGARLREWICSLEDFMNYKHLWDSKSAQNISMGQVRQFGDAFAKSSIKSIDIFMANNPKLAPVGKYIIAFEVFKAESQSCFREKAKIRQEHLAYAINHGKIEPRQLTLIPMFQGGDWYSYLYNRLIEGLVGKNALPDFSNGDLAFTTFNYDRSLEHFLYESLSNSFTEVPEPEVINCLKKLKILHVYGQIVPLKWQSTEGVDYAPQINKELLQKTSQNIRTIYEEKQNPDLIEAQNLLKQAEQIFFLGFGYAEENMEVLCLPGIIQPNCKVYGTAFNLIKEEAERTERSINHGRMEAQVYSDIRPTKIESNVDCLMLLRRYLR